MPPRRSPEPTIADLVERVGSLAEQLVDAVTAIGALAESATTQLDQYRANLAALLGADAAPPARRTSSPATSRPRRTAAASSDAGTSSPSPAKVERPTHCGAPDCGKKLKQPATGRAKQFCDNNCSYRARRAKAKADDAEDSPVRAERSTWIHGSATSAVTRSSVTAAASAATAAAASATRAAGGGAGSSSGVSSAASTRSTSAPASPVRLPVDRDAGVVDFRSLAAHNDGPTVAARPVGCGSCRACIGKSGPCTLGTRPELAAVPRAPDLSRARVLGGRDLPSSVIDCKPELPPTPVDATSYVEAIGFVPCRDPNCGNEELHERHDGPLPHRGRPVKQPSRGGLEVERADPSRTARCRAVRPTTSPAPDGGSSRTTSGGSTC